MNLNIVIYTGFVSFILWLFKCSLCLTADLEILIICHRGNILLSRKDSEMLQFTLEGKNMLVKTFGLSISIIDFTLSRINTGEIYTLITI